MNPGERDALERLASAHFATVVLNSFTGNFDEVIASRVIRLQKRLTDLSETFTELHGNFARQIGDFEESAATARENALRINALNEELEEEFHRSGTTMDGMSENVATTVDATYETLNQFLEVKKMSEDIQKIAKQTNLLALNASIEACPGGGARPGFFRGGPGGAEAVGAVSRSFGAYHRAGDGDFLRRGRGHGKYPSGERGLRGGAGIFGKIPGAS